MGKTLALALLILFTSACDRQASGPQPSCFPKRPSSKPLTSAEKKALANSKLRTFATCHTARTQCGFGVGPSPDGKIVVHVVVAAVEGSPLSCGYVLGGDQFNVYSQVGDYERTIRGL